jgi:Meiotically up-regulated gene 113
MLQHLADLVREVGHYPVIAELKMKARAAKTFPSPKTFERFGGKRGVAARLQAFALERGIDDVAALCAPFIATGEEGDTATTTTAEAAPVGVVCLVKSGRFYKVGRSNALGRRQYELAIQLPEQATLVHSIATDDPPSVEGYWHRRFADRRRHGEWFELTTEDVSAFRRRKFM